MILSIEVRWKSKDRTALSFLQRTVLLGENTIPHSSDVNYTFWRTLNSISLRITSISYRAQLKQGLAFLSLQSESFGLITRRNNSKLALRPTLHFHRLESMYLSSQGERNNEEPSCLISELSSVKAHLHQIRVIMLQHLQLRSNISFQSTATYSKLSKAVSRTVNSLSISSG